MTGQKAQLRGGPEMEHATVRYGRPRVRWSFVFSAVSRAFALSLVLVALPTLASWSPVLLLLLGVPVIVSCVTRGRAFWAWTAYVLGFVVFVLLRARADKVGFPLRIEYPILLDTWLGFGALPTVTLQGLFGGRAFDWTMIGIYLSYFLIPPAVAIALWLTKRGLERFVGAMLILYAGGLFVHLFLPTAPPWMASGLGLAPHLDRVLFDVAYPAAPQFYDASYEASQNDVAAMPSMHIAVTVLAVLGMTRLHPALVPAGVIYIGAMTLCIVYLGEHYLVDALAGIAFALVAWRIVDRLWTRPLYHNGQ